MSVWGSPVCLGGGSAEELTDIFGEPQTDTGTGYEITSDRGVYNGTAYRHNAFCSGGGVWGSATSGVPAWIRYRFTDGKKRVIRAFLFTTCVSAYGGGFSATAFTLQGSNDDFVTFDTLYIYSGSATYNAQRVFLTSNTAYSAFRIYITATNGTYYPAVNGIGALGYIRS